jgi:hypothetical protein
VEHLAGGVLGGDTMAVISAMDAVGRPIFEYPCVSCAIVLQ